MTGNTYTPCTFAEWAARQLNPLRLFRVVRNDEKGFSSPSGLTWYGRDDEPAAIALAR